MLLEALLGNAVECERRHGALQARGGKTQVQWEQQQPVNVSSSIQIMRLFIALEAALKTRCNADSSLAIARERE